MSTAAWLLRLIRVWRRSLTNRWRQIRSTNEPFFPLLFVNHLFPAVKPNTAVFQCTFSNKIQCYHKSRKMLSSSSTSWLFLAKTKNIYDSRTKHTDLMRNDIILCRNAKLMSRTIKNATVYSNKSKVYIDKIHQGFWVLFSKVLFCFF